MRLFKFTARRIAQLLPVLLGVTLVTFILVRVLPGDPVRAIAGPTANADDIAALRERFGLNKPLVVQYWDYLTGLVTGDFGMSIQSGQSIGYEMSVRIGPTLELAVAALLIALVIAIIFGIAVSFMPGSIFDHVVRIGSLIGNALPDFWLGMMLILVFYHALGWAPAPSGRLDTSVDLELLTGADLIDALLSGNFAAVGSALAHLALPATALAIVVCAALLRSVRSSALEVREHEAFHTAVAHGITGRRLVSSYLSRMTLSKLPALTALVFGNLIGSTVLIEYVFSWQGLGQWALRGLQYRDYAVVQAAVFVFAFCYVIAFLVADIVHAALDPRVKI